MQVLKHNVTGIVAHWTFKYDTSESSDRDVENLVTAWKLL